MASMTRERIQELLDAGESFTIEYKECIKGLNDSVIESVASMSNRYGGHMLLGVREREDGTGEVVGVDQKCAPDMKKNFVNILNEPNKITPSLYLNLEEFDYDGKLILWVYIPISSQVEIVSGRILDRNEDADQDITNSNDLVANLFRRKSADYHERKIFPYAKTDHLHMEYLSRIRNMARAKRDAHPWVEMDDMELLRSAGLYEENMLTGEKGFNLAAILILGKDEAIQSACPGYRTDAIYRNENPDRYDDRLVVEKNLIDAYDELMEFVRKHTDDRFFLVDNVNISVRDIIAKEIISNLLVHREYSSAFPAKLVIEPDRITTENWNRVQTPGIIDPVVFEPYPKNPTIAKFFMNIGRADSLGSGVRNLYKYTKIYCGGEPELREGDVFKVFVPMAADEAGNVNIHRLTERQQEILNAIKDNPKTQVEELMNVYDVSRSTILRDIQEIKKEIVLKYDKSEQLWHIG